MKIELNGKALLGIAILSTSLVVADFVSVANVKSNGGINIVGDTVEDSISAIMPVGSVVLRIDSTNPATLYGGTWSLISGDASLTFGDGSDLTGLVDGGENEPSIPLKSHTHSVTINSTNLGTKTTNTTGNHYHHDGLNIGAVTTTRYGLQGGLSTASIRSENSGNTQAIQYSVKTNTTGNHSHTVTLGSHNHSGSTAAAGETNPTIDVRGARIAINVWKRTG